MSPFGFIDYLNSGFNKNVNIFPINGNKEEQENIFEIKSLFKSEHADT